MPPYRYYLFTTKAGWREVGWQEGKYIERLMETCPKNWEGMRLAKVPL